MRSDFVLGALGRALYERHPTADDGRGHHADRRSPSVGVRSSERLAEAGRQPSVGGVDVAYANALAEMINRLCKAEVIHRRAPWKTEGGRRAGNARMGRANHGRLLAPIGHVPPAEAEAADHRQPTTGSASPA